MKLAFSQEMQSVDRLATAQFNLTPEVLMETAGQAAAECIHEKFPSELSKGKILVLVGPGNNGADSLVVARHLHVLGYTNIDMFFAVGESANRLFQLQLERVRALNIPFVDRLEDKYAVVIDGIFGIGLNKPVEGGLKTIIDTVNSWESFRYSLDVPSGLNVDTGHPMGTAIRANVTITFGLGKPGFYIQEGPSYTGQLIIKNIGFPKNLLDRTAQSVFLFERKDAREMLRPESTTANKSQRGKLLVIAGSENYWGAGLLCCKAALRVGAGYVYWASYQNPLSYLPEQPELIVKSLDHIQTFSTFDAIVVGPGLGVDEATYKLLARIDNDNVIVDADALTSLAQFGVRQLNPNWLITPHSGELSRLIGVTAAEIESDRFKAIEKAKNMLGCNVLLKGFRTIVGGEKFWIIGTGNKALAKAGSGDVLAGIIGGVACQKRPVAEAALLGAYIHGLIADNWVNEGKSDRSMTPSDLVNDLPRALKWIETE